MFGLMRSRSSCSQSPEERLRRRLHYCGTCKTIGRLYGQRPRALLNFDVVFAAELLTSLSGADVAGWDGAYQSVNCLRLPTDAAIAPELRYAAAINVVLAEIKVDDAIADGGTSAWRLARVTFSKSFRRAADDLEALGLDVDALRACVAEQAATERALAASAGERPADSLLAAARATAEATALVFEHGASVAGVDAARADMRAFGLAFGALVYTIDALRDVAEDARSGAFNAVLAAYGIDGDRLPPVVRAEVVRRARGFAAEAEAALRRLPIPADRAARFADRLAVNLSRLGLVRRLPVRAEARHARSCSPVPVAKRRAAAIAVARSLVASRAAACRPLPARLAEAPFVAVVGAFAGFVAPHLAGHAPSLGACVDASLSLAAVGSAFAAMAVPPPLPPGPIDPTRPRRSTDASEQSTGDSGGSDCFDCGDCCDCCECSCQSCECAACTCESCSCCESAECCSACDCCGSCDCCSCDC